MDYRKIRKAAIDQGWRVLPTRSGEMFYSPDGISKALWHHTPSDQRAVKNFLAELKRGGLRWLPSRKR